MTSANKFDQKQKFETGVKCPGSIVRGNLRIPLIKSIRQGGVLFTPVQLTPDS